MNPSEQQQQQTNGAALPEAKQRPTSSRLGFDISDLEISREVSARLVDMEVRIRDFELNQREGAVYAACSIIPDSFKNNTANCSIALNMAHRIGVDPLMVMQNLYIVHGRPSWSAQFLIAAFNSSGGYGPIQYRFSGAPNTDTYGCIAYAMAKNGTRAEGPLVTWAMAKAEGWTTKTDKHGNLISKWLTMPELMFRYRAATFLVRTVAPEITMGFLTAEEIIDRGADAELTMDSETEMTGVREGTLADQRKVAGEKIAALTAQATAQRTPVTDAPAPTPEPTKPRFRLEIEAAIKMLGSYGIALLGDNGFENADQIPENQADAIMAVLDEAIAKAAASKSSSKLQFGGKK
jgi:hypothetical protein